jgi:hypothetical protein
VALLDDDEPLLEELSLDEPSDEPLPAAEVSPGAFDDALDDPLLERFAPFRLSVR